MNILETNGKITAQQKLEQYFSEEISQKNIVHPPTDDGESKAQYCWRIIRGSLSAVVKILKSADVENKVIRHGINHLRKIQHPNAILHVAYNKNTKVR